MIEWWVALAGPMVSTLALGIAAVLGYGQLKERVSANDRLQAERYKALKETMETGFKNLGATLTAQSEASRQRMDASDKRIDRLDKIVNGRFGTPSPM